MIRFRISGTCMHAPNLHCFVAHMQHCNLALLNSNRKAGSGLGRMRQDLVLPSQGCADATSLFENYVILVAMAHEALEFLHVIQNWFILDNKVLTLLNRGLVHQGKGCHWWLIQSFIVGEFYFLLFLLGIQMYMIVCIRYFVLSECSGSVVIIVFADMVQCIE